MKECETGTENLSTKKKGSVQSTNAKPGLSCSRKDAEKSLFKLIPAQDAVYFF